MTNQTWQLPFTKGAAWEARRHVAGVLRENGVDPAQVEIAALLVSEIVSNAVMHGEGPLSLSIIEIDNGWRLRVRDCSPDYPTVRSSSPEREGGRGLMLVDALSKTWGAEPVGDGCKDVWFTI